MSRTLIASFAGTALLAGCGAPVSNAPEAEGEIASAEPPESLPEPIAAMISEEFSELGTFNLSTGVADLDGDGTDEWLVYVAGPMICGSGGCPLRVFKDGDGGPSPIGSLSVTQLPVGVFASETDGWRDLAVSVGGGGIEYSLAKVPWTGEAYASNPTVAPAEPSEEEFTTVISMSEFE